MARIQFSGLVSGIKGKLGGSVFQGGTGGYIIRNNARRGRAKSVRWEQARSALVHFAALWQQLPGTNKNQWSAFATSLTTYGMFGNPLQMNGQHAFIMVNRNRHICGLSPINSPVASSGLAVSPNFSMDVVGASDLVLNYGVTSSDYSYVIATKRQYNGAGLTSPGGYKQIVVLHNPPFLTLDITSYYEAAWGVVLAGASLEFKWRQIHRDSGLSSTWHHGKASV